MSRISRATSTVRDAALVVQLLVSASFRVTPGASFLCLAETLGVILTSAQPWLLAKAVDATAAADFRLVMMYLGAVGASFGLSRALFSVGLTARIGQLERLGYHFDGRRADLSARIPTIGHFADREYLDQVQILDEEDGALGLAFNQLLNALNTAVGVVGTLIVASSADARMLLVVAGSFMLLTVSRFSNRWQRRAEEDGAGAGRLTRILADTLTRPEHADEVQLFGLGPSLRARLAAAVLDWRRPRVQAATRTAVLTATTQVFFWLVAGSVLTWILSDVLRGVGGAGSFTLAVLVLGQIQRTASDTQNTVGNLARVLRTGSRFLWLERYTRQNEPCETSPRTSMELRRSIEFHGVTYRPPTASAPILEGIDLRISVGTTVALVGRNGAGKTTLANLVLGLLEATSGRVEIDGVPRPSRDSFAWYTQFTGAFQDHVRFEFDVRTDIAFGDLSDRSEEAVARAARDGAAEEVIRDLPRGLDTRLGVSWPDGVDLSGGQWQRVALARGMMKATPALRVFDEPTAALDARTENELFTSMIRTAQQTDATTILVTHRFSTVSEADLILVLDEGRIVERGTHDELMHIGGIYAELYDLQRTAYQS